MTFSKREKRIFGKTTDWVIQGGVFAPLAAIIPAEAITFVLKNRFPPLVTHKIIEVYLNAGDKGYWIFDRDDMARRGEWCFRNSRYIRQVYRQWEIDKRAFYGMIRGLEQGGIQNLKEDFLTFYRVYLDEYSLPLITEYYSVAGDNLIKKLQFKYGASVRLDEEIVIFTKPAQLSFLQEYVCAMLRLALSVKKNIPTKVSDLKKQNNAIYQELVGIQQKYFWIHFNYRDTQPLTVAYFYDQLRSMRSKKSVPDLRRRYHELKTYENNVRKTQRRLMHRSMLNQKEIRILKSIGFAAHWQDQRKAANLIANYWCNEFARKASRKYSLSFELLQHLTPREFIALLESGKMPKGIKQRLKGGLYCAFSDRTEVFFTGSTFVRLWKRIADISQLGQVRQLAGIAASAGVYRGRIRRVETPAKDGKHLKKGEVLVAYMTRPDYVPLMHKAGAIVTDEGGLTSHAAIIARELKVPCIVGTRLAMRVLKDGDIVEVDAGRGVVTIIK